MPRRRADSPQVHFSCRPIVEILPSSVFMPKNPCPVCGLVHYFPPAEWEEAREAARKLAEYATVGREAGT